MKKEIIMLFLFFIMIFNDAIAQNLMNKRWIFGEVRASQMVFTDTTKPILKIANYL